MEREMPLASTWAEQGLEVARRLRGEAEDTQGCAESTLVCNTGSSQPTWPTSWQNTLIQNSRGGSEGQDWKVPQSRWAPGQTDEETKAQRGLWQRPARDPFSSRSSSGGRRQFGRNASFMHGIQ